MNLRQLECFVAVVDEGSFTRAPRARRDHPAVALAAHPGAGGGARRARCSTACRAASSLTPAGRSLLPEARTAVRAVERGRQERARRSRSSRRARDRDRALDGRRVCCRDTSASGTSAIRTSSIRLHEFRHRTLLEDAVEHGVADFAVGPLPLAPLGGAARDGRVGGVRRRRRRADDPLAGRERSALEELADREWVLYHPDHGLAGIVEEICRRAGFTPARHRAHLPGGGRGAARRGGARARARPRQHRPARRSSAPCCDRPAR